MSPAFRLELSPRLRIIADQVPPGARMADVGSDHGLLPLYLLSQDRIPSAIATDIHAAPLERGRQAAVEQGMEDRVSFRLCDGLAAVLPEEVDVIAIAGMGGETIAGILNAAAWSREKLLLLQPMSRSEVLRPWLAGHGCAIRQEVLVLDRGHVYPVLTVEGGTMPPLTAVQRYCGLSPRDGPLFLGYLRRWIERIERACAGLEQGGQNGEAAALRSELTELREEEKLWSR